MTDLSERIQAPTRMVRVTVMFTADVEAGDAPYLPSTPEEYATTLALRAVSADDRLTNYRVVGVAAGTTTHASTEGDADE